MIRFPRTLAVLALVALHGSAFAQGCQPQTSNAPTALKPARIIRDEDLPPLPAPIPARPFATVPDSPAEHPYKPRKLDLD